MRLPLILAAALAVAAAAAAPVRAQDEAAWSEPEAEAEAGDEADAVAPPYVWHAAGDDSIAWGVPETDDRGVRIDCAGGVMRLTAPVDPEIVEDGRVKVMAWGPGGMDMVEATTVELGDGLNFVAPLPAPSDALDGLMKGQDMTLMLLGEERVIPGAGAPAVLGPLMTRCGVGG